MIPPFMPVSPLFNLRHNLLEVGFRDIESYQHETKSDVLPKETVAPFRRAFLPISNDHVSRSHPRNVFYEVMPGHFFGSFKLGETHLSTGGPTANRSSLSGTLKLSLGGNTESADTLPDAIKTPHIAGNVRIGVHLNWRPGYRPFEAHYFFPTGDSDRRCRNLEGSHMEDIAAKDDIPLRDLYHPPLDGFALG